MSDQKPGTPWSGMPMPWIDPVERRCYRCGYRLHANEAVEVDLAPERGFAEPVMVHADCSGPAGSQEQDNPIGVVRRRRLAGTLHTQGMSQRAIARVLGVHQTTVVHDLAAIGVVSQYGR
jgi:hypothetical protein